jgi:hypothetical protein
VKRSRQCISGNPDNFTVSISFEYEIERLVAVIMKKRSSVINKTYEALVRFPGFPEFHFIADQLIKVKLLQDKSDYIYRFIYVHMYSKT